MALNVTRPSRFRSYFAHLETEDETTVVYTCPQNSVAYMSLIYLANNDNSNSSDHSIDIYRAQEDTTYHILSSKNLNSAEFLQLSNAFMVLEPGDRLEITVSGNATPHSDIITTVEEVFLPNG
jgi:hypothetical protein